MVLQFFLAPFVEMERIVYILFGVAIAFLIFAVLMPNFRARRPHLYPSWAVWGPYREHGGRRYTARPV